MTSEFLIRETRERFPVYGGEPVDVNLIERGGSDRKFYRIRMGGEHSVILIKYNPERAENCHYVEIDRFLQTLGMHVPQMYFHDPKECLIWMEDMGDRDVWSIRAEPWSERGALYRKALAEVARLHHADPVGAAGLTLQPQFDGRLYRWEQDYFIQNCLGSFFKLDAGELAECEGNETLRGLAARLASLPRVLVHRDFQSQNLMIREDDVYLIDFQGMRLGLAQYDLASLLYDPYVRLSDTERGELLDCYAGLAIDAGVALPADFREVFDLCAIQRLMQALGAYGFLGLVKGRRHFLDHIPAALGSLREVMQRVEGLESLGAMVARLADSRSRAS